MKTRSEMEAKIKEMEFSSIFKGWPEALEWVMEPSEKGNSSEDMPNLTYCSRNTKDAVYDIMNALTVGDFTKQIIREGLQKDCLDAAAYVQLALDILVRVRNDICQ